MLVAILIVLVLVLGIHYATRMWYPPAGTCSSLERSMSSAQTRSFHGGHGGRGGHGGHRGGHFGGGYSWWPYWGYRYSDYGSWRPWGWTCAPSPDGPYCHLHRGGLYRTRAICEASCSSS